MANCRVHLSIQPRQSVGLRVSNRAGASLSLGGLLYDRAADVWAGPYDVVPSQVEQVLPVEGCRMAHDVVVAPIPSQYGLITYNGGTITVS